MNDHQVRQKQRQDAQRQFLSALSSGQVKVRDRFGNEVQVGQKVLYRPPFDLVYEVVTVNPVLDPKAPPGLMSVTLSVTFPATVQANQPWAPAIVVAQAEAKPVIAEFPRPVEATSDPEEEAIPEAAEPVALQDDGPLRDRSDAPAE